MDITRYSKLIAALAAFTLYVLAQMVGLDLGEVGVGVDMDVLLSGALASASVYFSPRNSDPE